MNWSDQLKEIFQHDFSSNAPTFGTLVSSIHPHYRDAWILAVQDCVAHGTSFKQVFRKIISGRDIWIEARVAASRGANSDVKGLSGTFQDVTDDVKARADLEAGRLRTLHVSKLAALGELSAGVAHEINNPLAVIDLVAGQILRHASNPEELRIKVEVLRRSCQRIAKIVRGLKKFSRSGDKPEMRRHQLRLIVEEAVTLVNAKAKTHKVSVSVECSSQRDVFCDELEIEQVMVNLFMNAIDAIKDAPEKWVKVTIEDTPVETIMRVTDSGPGIPESIRNASVIGGRMGDEVVNLNA